MATRIFWSLQKEGCTPSRALTDQEFSALILLVKRGSIAAKSCQGQNTSIFERRDQKEIEAMFDSEGR